MHARTPAAAQLTDFQAISAPLYTPSRPADAEKRAAGKQIILPYWF